MGRLIDEDEVIKAVDKHTKDCSEIVLDNDISCILEEVPTAYDVEKVVAELEHPNNYTIVAGHHCTTVDRAIDIVKRGVVE